jgi:hypothetical protein
MLRDAEMGVKGRPPKRAGGFVTFTWDRCPPKHKATGYLAGDVHGIECHVGGRTKPCERLLLGEHVSCPGCAAGKPIDWHGYVPLRDGSGRPVCILVRYSVYDVVTRIKPGSSVMWGRDDDKFAPVTMVEWRESVPWSKWWPDRKPADDMVPWLVKFWGLPHLETALRSYFAGEVKGPTDLPALIPHDAPPVVDRVPWIKGVADSLAVAEKGQTFDQVRAKLGATAKRLPATNGKKS